MQTNCGESDNITSSDLVRAFFKFRRIGLFKGKPFEDFSKQTSDRLKHSEIMLLLSMGEIEKDYVEGIPVSELSNYLYVKPPSITPIISSLEDKNLIHRRNDTTDRRITRLTLTDSGKKIIEAKIKNRNADMQGLFNHLGMEKCNQLASLLNEVSDYFTQLPQSK